MKKIIFVIALMSTLAISAKEVNSMKCTIQSSYLNFENEIEVDLNDPIYGSGPVNSDTEWEIAWSQSECEDSTSIKFDLKEFKSFMAGDISSIYGRMNHDEPSIVFEADVVCRPN